uniref:L1 transposable element RRM domain-containing protein n=1 Tax=Xiphophorus maculatus TaxID=8083 RepID=A0A3B5RDH1_XIPMA
MPPKPVKGGNSIQSHLRPAPRGESSACAESTLVSEAAARAAAISDASSLKQQLLAALRDDFTAILKAEFHSVLGESLSSIKSELLSFKKELSSGLTVVQESFTGLNVTVAEMEKSLSTCTDDIVGLRKTVDSLTKTVAQLENKCDDLESRSRSQNIRIIGVPEDDPLSASTAAVSQLLKEAFGFAEEPLLDRAHRIPIPKPKAGERPRPIVAKLHYYSDCVKILSKARELQRIKMNGTTIFVFPDYTVRTARARAAFTDCRRRLRGIEGVRFGLLHPARLQITHGGTTRVFTSPEEAHIYIESITKGWQYLSTSVINNWSHVC